MTEPSAPLPSPSASRHPTAVAVERATGIVFSNPGLVVRALTHSSFTNESPEGGGNNERLEFLGDAVLDYLVAYWLYQHFPELPEGDLTRMRSTLVRTEALAAFAAGIALLSGIALATPLYWPWYAACGAAAVFGLGVLFHWCGMDSTGAAEDSDDQSVKY